MRTFMAISILAVAVLAMSGCGTSQTNSWEEYMLVCHQPDGNWVYSKDEKKSPPGEEYEESVGFVPHCQRNDGRWLAAFEWC